MCEKDNGRSIRDYGVLIMNTGKMGTIYCDFCSVLCYMPTAKEPVVRDHIVMVSEDSKKPNILKCCDCMNKDKDIINMK